MATSQAFRDPARTFTPNGRPMRKPRKIAMRLSSISSRRDLGDFYVIERPHGKTWKYMSLQECRDSRPPVKPDLEGPTPCTYSVAFPLSTIIGGKINPRTRHKRDVLPYPNTEVWTHNVNVSGKFPTPCTYTAPNVFGGYCPAKREAPAYTMHGRKFAPLPQTGSVKGPGPSSYDTAEAKNGTLRHFPAFTIASKKEGAKPTSTPGPAHYHPNYSYCQHKSPAYSMRRRTKTSSVQ